MSESNVHVPIREDEVEELMQYGQLVGLDVDKFCQNQVEPNVETFDQDQSRRPSSDWDMKSYDDVLQDFDNVSIRGERARPGNLGNEKLDEDPTRYQDEYEVYNPDKIPLETYKRMSRDPVFRMATYIIKSWVGSLEYNIQSDSPVIEEVIRYSLSDIWKPLTRGMLDQGMKFTR